MFEKHKLAISIAVLVIVLCAGTALAIIYMPNKSEWANDYRQYESTLADDDPLHQTLAPMLADGKLSIWEISGVLCGDAYGCRLNNFADVLLSPDAADMFAQTVLVGLKHGAIARDRKKLNETVSPQKYFV
jgi:hypothetical protein